MGNRKSREFLLQQEHDASWERLRSEPWSPEESRRATGSGLRRIQLVHLPSFSPSSFWEICQRGPDWLLYRAEVVDSARSSLTVRGYDRVEIDGAQLMGYFDRLVALTLPVAPHLSNMGGLDGTMTHLTLFGGLQSQVRFKWWSDPPTGWTPLVQIAEEMIETFTDRGDSRGST